MKPIKPVLLEIQKPIVGNADVASSEAIMVTTYSELQELIAQLSILNKRYVLYFRGQKEDYTSDDNAKNGNPHFIQQYSVELSLQGRVILDGINWIMQVSGW